MTLFIRATLAALTLAIGWSPSSFAQDSTAGACVDFDGDGYGWNGVETCLTGAIPVITQPSECVDSDGDGYGWNGLATCLVSDNPDINPTSDDPLPGDDINPTGNDPLPVDDPIPDSDDPDDDTNPDDDVSPDPIDSDNTADNSPAQTPDNSIGRSPDGISFSSTFSPLGNAATDQCLTLQDTINGNYPGVITAGDFILSVNAWNFGAAGNYDWEQCIFANSDSLGWTYDWGAGGGPGDFNVRSYPELIYGVKSGGEISGSSSREGTGLPARIDLLPAITIDYDFTSNENGPARTVQASANPLFPNGTIIRGERNIAVESFFHPSDPDGNCPASVVERSGGSSNHTYEMMVWLDSGAERLPAGPSGFVTTATIDGASWDIYTKSNDLKYVAFVSNNPSLTGTLDWSAFIEWTSNNAHRVSELFGAQTDSVQLQDDWCLANILVGNEIWWGGGSFSINEWQINRTY